MKTFFITILFSFVLLSGQAQITKNNWLVGGAANFTSTNQKNNYSADNLGATSFSLLPNIGYFIADKFALGISPGIAFNKTKGNNIESHVTTYKIGPFARYYFLESENNVNLFIHGGFNYGISRFKNSGSSLTKAKNISYIIAGGPVVYFNTSVGLEFTAGWNYLKTINEKSSSNSLLLGIGLQIHLEK